MFYVTYEKKTGILIIFLDCGLLGITKRDKVSMKKKFNSKSFVVSSQNFTKYDIASLGLLMFSCICLSQLLVLYTT